MQTNKSFSSNTRFQRNRVKSFENMGHSNHFSHNHDNKKKFNKQRKFNGNRNTYGRYSETKDTKITTKVHMEKPTYVDEFPSLGKKVVKESVIRKTDDILKNNTYYVLANLICDSTGVQRIPNGVGTLTPLCQPVGKKKVRK